MNAQQDELELIIKKHKGVSNQLEEIKEEEDEPAALTLQQDVTANDSMMMRSKKKKTKKHKHHHQHRVVENGSSSPMSGSCLSSCSSSSYSFGSLFEFKSAGNQKSDGGRIQQVIKSPRLSPLQNFDLCLQGK